MKVQSIYSKTSILDNIIRVWLGIIRNTIKYIESYKHYEIDKVTQDVGRVYSC